MKVRAFNVKSFVSNNLVAIVMVPAIIGAHYIWYKLQRNDSLVSSKEREKLPLSWFFTKD